MAINLGHKQQQHKRQGGAKKEEHPHQLPPFWLNISKKDGSAWFQSGKLTDADRQKIINLLRDGHDVFRIYICDKQIDFSTLPEFKEKSPVFNIRLLPPVGQQQHEAQPAPAADVGAGDDCPF